MNRAQAVLVIKQIFEQCRLTEGKSIKLMPPKECNALSNTFQIHMQTRDDPFIISCLNRIAEEHNLEVKVKKDSAIIYKPYPNTTDP